MPSTDVTPIAAATGGSFLLETRIPPRFLLPKT